MLAIQLALISASPAAEMSTRSDSLEECKDQDIPEKITVDSEVDLTAYYERNAGRLVVDPE